MDLRDVLCGTGILFSLLLALMLYNNDGFSLWSFIAGIGVATSACGLMYRMDALVEHLKTVKSI